LTEYRYKAFISYSHQDEQWARWLQRALESYRVPGGLVGKRGNFGNVPARLGAIFRDREDLSSAANLTESVQQELAAAETLIVICSPAAAQSPWVNAEIRAFRALGRANRIYALIVDGDPQAPDRSNQCFPGALVESDDDATVEPMAADARKWADGKILAKVKLVAGILGVRLDELRQREMRRRRRNWILSGVTIAAAVLLTTILSVTAISNRKMAEQRRASTEELVSFMLGTLEDLSPVSGLDVLDEDQQEMIQLAEQLGFRALADAALLQKALDWRDEGMAARNRVDSQSAMTAFSNSLAALVHLYQRDTNNTDHLFEVGQAEFWVGYMHMDNGDLDQAEASMTRYGVVARRLINADPKSAENVMELSYTLTNLAAVESARVGAEHSKAIHMMQAALQYNQLANVLEPNNQLYMSELAESQAWLADTWLGVCNLDKAYQFRSANVALAKQMLEQQPDDPKLMARLAYARRGHAGVLNYLGLTDLALDGFRASATLLADLIREQPDSELYRSDRWDSLDVIGWILISEGRLEEAQELISESTRTLAKKQGQTDDLQSWKMARLADSWASRSRLAQEQGREKEAREFNLKAIRILSATLSESSDRGRSHNALGYALFRYWQLNDELPSADWRALVEDYSLSEPPVRSCAQAGLAARQAVMREELATARFYSDYLLGKGYQSASFLRFCRAYSLCD